MGANMEAAAERLERDVDAAVAESQPLLAWRETTEKPVKPPLRSFETGDGSYRLKVAEQTDGQWWLYLDCSGGRYLPPGTSAELARTTAIQWCMEKLERLLAELRRVVV